MRKVRAFLTISVLLTLAAGMILAAPPASAEDLTEEDVELDPASGWHGDALTVEITRTDGDDFSAWGALETCDFGAGIEVTVDDCEVADDDTITVDITVLESEEAQPGTRTVTIEDDSDPVNTIECTDCFTINGPTDVDPGEAEQGEESLPITITGNGFDGAPTQTAESVACAFHEPGETDPDDDITFDEECDFDPDNEATQLDAVITVAGEAATGPRDLRVDLFDDQGDEIAGATCFACFTVTAASEDDPDPTATPTPLPEAASDEDGPAPQLPDTGPREPLRTTGGGLTTAVLLVGTVVLAGGLVARGWKRRDMTEDT